MDPMIKRIASVMGSGTIVDPMDMTAIGVKNIYHYRDKFIKIVVDTSTTAETVKLVLQLMMSVKNRKRVIEGIKLSSTLKGDPELTAAVDFLEKHCSESTRNQTDTKMPVVKIPDSFPELCAGMFVTICCLKGVTNEDVIFKELIEKPWIASLALHPDVQAVNKAAVERMWNSWGKSAGTKKNHAGDILKFDDEIYANAEADAIPLINFDGSPVTMSGPGYDEQEIKDWIKKWLQDVIGGDVTFAGSKKVKTLTI